MKKICVVLTAMMLFSVASVAQVNRGTANVSSQETAVFERQVEKAKGKLATLDKTKLQKMKKRIEANLPKEQDAKKVRYMKVRLAAIESLLK